MTQPSPELRQWQKYVNLFERASKFVGTHTDNPYDSVTPYPTDTEPYMENIQKSYMLAVGSVALGEDGTSESDLLGEVVVLRASSRRWIPLGSSMFDGDAAVDDYRETLTINLYTATEQPELVRGHTIRFYDKWGDYRHTTMVDPAPERELVGEEVVASRMIQQLSGDSTAEMRSLLAAIIKATSMKRGIEQYPGVPSLLAPSPNDESN